MKILLINKTSNVPKYDSFVNSFLDLKFKKDHKDDYMNVVDSEGGEVDYRC